MRILNEHGISAAPGIPESHGREPDVKGVQGVHVECKRVERLNVPEAMKQAIRDSEKFRDGAPTLFHRRNREPWMVTMLLSDWLQMYQGANNEET